MYMFSIYIVILKPLATNQNRPCGKLWMRRCRHTSSYVYFNHIANTKLIHNIFDISSQRWPSVNKLYFVILSELRAIWSETVWFVRNSFFNCDNFNSSINRRYVGEVKGEIHQKGFPAVKKVKIFKFCQNMIRWVLKI